MSLIMANRLNEMDNGLIGILCFGLNAPTSVLLHV